jgi:hypothetical protein
MEYRPTIAPRLLTRSQAAAYCGLSVRTFASVCPVAPIAFNKSKKLQRYDVRALDRWLDGLAQNDNVEDSDWLARFDEDDDRARQGN